MNNKFCFDAAGHLCNKIFHLPTQVTITVKDNNDNAPVFITPGTITVLENYKSGAPVYRFSATDADIGRNGEVEYSLDTADRQLFSIGKQENERNAFL